MMNSYRQNKPRGRRRLAIATGIVVFLFLIDLVSHGAIRGVARAAGSMLWRSGSAAGADIENSGFFSSRASLASENAGLKSEIAQLQDNAGGVQALQQENAQLRALVHLAAASQGSTAPVISSVSASPYGTFVIGAGSADGITEGSLVLTADGFALGKVSSVSRYQSLVSGFFAPGASIDVLLGSVPVTLDGEGGGVASAQVPNGTTVAEGVVAEAPSLGQRPVGIVGSVVASPASPVEEILVRVPSNLASLTYVYVEAAK